MNKGLVVCIEDECAIRDMVVGYLNKAGYQAWGARDTEAAWALLKSQSVDLILLDWGLPRIDGLTFLRALRRHTTHNAIPVLMLTARAEEDDLVHALDQGADDYIAKPFSWPILLARMNTLLRRFSDREQHLCCGPLTLRSDERVLHHPGGVIELKPAEVRLLRVLMHAPNRLIERARLAEKIWGNKAGERERDLDVHISRLRRKLNAGGLDVIRTRYGSGYVFESKALES